MRFASNLCEDLPVPVEKLEKDGINVPLDNVSRNFSPQSCLPNVNDLSPVASSSYNQYYEYCES